MSRIIVRVLLSCLCWTAADHAQAEPLSSFFLASQVEEASSYRQEFAAVSTAEDMAGLYRQALALEKWLLAPVRARHQYDGWPLLHDFVDAELELPGLTPACAAECTEPAFHLDVARLSAAASQTEGEADEDFFRLVDEFYYLPVILDGEITIWARFFERTWDYGGHSLLGQGMHLALLRRMDDFIGRHSTFLIEVGELRRQLMQDLMERSSCSGLPAADAVRELEQILEEVQLSKEEAAAVSSRLAAFQHPEAHDIESDCRQGSCSCNTG